MVAVFILDRGQRCRYLNAVAEVLSGVTAANAAGRVFSEVVWSRTPDPFEGSPLARTMSSGKPGEGDTALVDPTGVLRPISFRVVPVDFDGNDAATVVELVDLSGETGTGRALRESEQRLRLATEATGIGIWDVNGLTGERRWSPEFLAILGLKADDPPTRERFQSLIHPDDQDRINAIYDSIFRAESGGLYDAEFRIRRADNGEERWVHTTGRVSFDQRGRPLRAIGTLRDIHQRRMNEEALRLSEERLRLSVAANEIGTWDYDMVAGTSLWSDQFKALWGLPPGAPSDPELLHPLVDSAQIEETRRRFAAAATPGSDGRMSIEYRFRRADTGEQRWALFSGRVFFDDAGQRPLRALGIMMDTTARRATEDRQRRLLAELHHRIKNTLAVAQSIVSQTLLAARREDAFESIQSRLMSLGRAHDFLSRSEDGEVPLRALIQSELELLGEDTHPGVSLTGDFVVIDSATTLALALAFHELASNAHRFGSLSNPDGTLSVAWRVVDGAAPQLEIVWTEKGTPPYLANPGYGLGMRLVETSLKRSLGGSAEAKFEPDGVVWTLRLPYREVALSRL